MKITFATITGNYFYYYSLKLYIHISNGNIYVYNKFNTHKVLHLQIRQIKHYF